MRILQTIFCALFLTHSLSSAAETSPDCFHPKSYPEEEARNAAEALFDSILKGSGAGAKVLPAVWTKRLQTEELNFNELAKTHYEGGRAYGAVAFQKLDFTFARAKSEFSQPGFGLKLLENVKTLRNTEEVESPGNSTKEFCVRTAIEVPVRSDFHTDVKVRYYEPSDNKAILEWKQTDGLGELSYNQGAAILEPDGDKSRLTVIAVHIIKQTEKVPWVGRALARSFTKTHYGNFIEAFNKTVEEFQSRK